MPIYEYRCTNEHRFEVLQRFSDEPLTECEVCGAPASRVLYPAAIHFKGSGFYSTDYGRRARKGGDGESKGDGKGDAKSDGGSSSDGAKGDSSKGEKAKAAEA
jgi:putative FmdB family regulatory protein